MTRSGHPSVIALRSLVRETPRLLCGWGFTARCTREFITLLGSAAATWPVAARAQRAGKLPTIGFLGSGTSSSHGRWVAAFAKRLSELGWIDGRTVAIEARWAQGRSEHAAEIAADFVRLKVDVVATTRFH